MVGSLNATCRTAIIGDQQTLLHPGAVRYAPRRLRASAAAGCPVCSNAPGAATCARNEEEPRGGHSVFSWLGSFSQLGVFTCRPYPPAAAHAAGARRHVCVGRSHPPTVQAVASLAWRAHLRARKCR